MTSGSVAAAVPFCAVVNFKKAFDMLLLMFYVGLAIGVSFVCSVAEAVLLSVTPSYISLLEGEGRERAAKRLRKLKSDINAPLAAILTLNTIAHTAGAAGAGAQAALVFGSEFLGLISAVLTILILVFSEIIPKTLGAVYWRQFAPSIAVLLLQMVFWLKPFVKISAQITSLIGDKGGTGDTFNRAEIGALAEYFREHGQLSVSEERMIKNLLSLNEAQVKSVLTPRTVVFSVDQDSVVEDFLNSHEGDRFSRVPIHGSDPEDITGYVLRVDVLLAHARGDTRAPLSKFRRPIHSLHESTSLLEAFHFLLQNREQICVVFDEHGGFEGLVTLEDIIEELLGMEIVDEGDRSSDMRRFALLQKKLKDGKKAGPS